MVQLINEGSTQPASNITEVGVDNFIQEVVEKSNSVPVLVDFWAPWCEPCKSLTPILEEIAGEHDESLQLVKINIDENQELATQFAVRSVPTVFLVKGGEVVDGFMGAQPKNAIEQFLSKHITTKTQEDEDRVQVLLNQGRVSEAIELLKAEDTDKAYIRLATVYMHQRDFQNSRDALSKVKEEQNKPEYKSIAAALEFAEIAENCASEDELSARVLEDDKDWDAHYNLAAIKLVRGDMENALETLLKIVQNDRSFNDDAGRRGLIKAFDMLGTDHSLITKFRGLLARTLH